MTVPELPEPPETGLATPDLTVLAVGAHPDDIEIGAGGTLAAHAAAGHRVVMVVLTEGQAGPDAAASSRREEQARAAQVLGAEVVIGPFVDSELGPMQAVIAYLEGVFRDARPDVVFTHAADDSHQDHRTTHDAVLSAGRDLPTLLLWASPTTLHFNPTLYVEVTDFVETKLAALAEHRSQVAESRRVNPTAIEGAVRFRGAQVGVDCAEAFEPVRALVTTSRASRRPRPYAWARLSDTPS